MSFVFEAAVFLVYYLFAYFSWFAFFSDMWSLKEKLLGGAWGISCKLLQVSLQWRGWSREWVLHLSAHLFTVPGTRNRTWPVLGPLPLGPMRVKALVSQSCLALYDPMDGSPPGSSVHGILQARILEWVAMPFSKGKPHPGIQPRSACVAGRFFTVWTWLLKGKGQGQSG